MPADILLFWPQLISILGAIVLVVLWMNRRFNQIDRHFDTVDRRLERIEIRLGIVEHQSRSLLTAFRPVLSSLVSGQPIPQDEGFRLLAEALKPAPIDALIREIQHASNPLSPDEVNRLRDYIDRLRRGRRLSPDEAREFYTLSDILTREYPTHEASWLLYVLAGILIGLILAEPRRG